MKIRNYRQQDHDSVCRLFEDFIDYFIALDPLHRVTKQPQYGQKYLEKTLRQIKEKNGLFLVAEANDQIIGFGTAIVGQLSADDLLEVLPHTPGRITDLYVDKKYQGQGIGTKLLKALEAYLEQKKCDTIHIEVFAPNKKAQKFYQKLGYLNRNLDVIKIINK